MSFGEEMKMVRKEKGFTLHDVQEKTGLTTSYLSKIENGKRGTPKPDALKKLANGLSMDYINLLDKAGYLDGGISELLYLAKTDELKNELKKRGELGE